MKFYLILLLLFNYGYSQDILHIKTVDTIFVSFKADKFQTKLELPKNNFVEINYYINNFQK
jgi:hypothetical protein